MSFGIAVERRKVHQGPSGNWIVFHKVDEIEGTSELICEMPPHEAASLIGEIADQLESAFINAEHLSTEATG